MTRQEAAQFLDCSVAQLDRYKAAGLLHPGKSRGKTRPVLVYEEADLVRFRDAKAGVATPDVVAPEGRAAPTSHPVGFRLDPFYRERLQAKAEAAGMGPGDYARHLVIKDLESDAEDRMGQEMHRLRKQLVDAFFALALQPETKEAKDRRKVADHFIEIFLKG